jgi:glycosyltransferase involved in cell wall biosynthesis
MASGVPVVASRVGGLPDIVADGRAGLLVPPGDPRALGGAIARLLADPVRRHAMGEAARADAERFGARAVVDRIEAIYDEEARR